MPPVTDVRSRQQRLANKNVVRYNEHVLPLSLLGVAGFVAMEASYLPQITRIFRRGRADDLSWFFPALNVLGRLAAFSYAMSKGDNVFSLGFAAGMVLRSTLLAQVLYYRFREPAPRGGADAGGAHASQASSLPSEPGPEAASAPDLARPALRTLRPAEAQGSLR